MKIKEGFVLRKMCGENIVAGEGLQHINFNKLLSLNESAAYLWQELTGKEFTLEEMAELLVARYGIDKQLAMTDSERLINGQKSEFWNNYLAFFSFTPIS